MLKKSLLNSLAFLVKLYEGTLELFSIEPVTLKQFISEKNLIQAL